MTNHKRSLDRIVETAIYLNTESRRLAREQCAKLGITATQLSVLKLLHTVGDLSLSELSRRIAATNSTVTGIVDRMVAADLVVREQSVADRRVWKIRLAAPGKALANRAELAPWDILRNAVMALPARERMQLIATLETIAKYVGQAVEERTASDALI